MLEFSPRLLEFSPRQIIEAAGWQAVYRDDDGGLLYVPLAAFAVCDVVEAHNVGGALAREDHTIRMAGFDVCDGHIECCEEMVNFETYLGPGEVMPPDDHPPRLAKSSRLSRPPEVP